MSHLSHESTTEEIQWRKDAKADTSVLMYEDELTGDTPSIYLTTTINNSGQTNYQGWHYYCYDLLRRRANSPHLLLIPGNRKYGGFRKNKELQWRHHASILAEHLIFYLPRGMTKSDQVQVTKQIDVALQQFQTDARQRLWVVSELGLDFSEATEKTLKSTGHTIYKNLSAVIEGFMEFA